MHRKEVGGRAFTADEIDAHNAGVSTDWVPLVLDNGFQQNHQLSVRGGSAKTGFALSANYFNEGGIVEIQDFTRYTFRVNLDHKASDRFRVGTSTQVSNSVQNWASNPYSTALNISPLAEPYDADGEIVYRPGADPLLWSPLADFVEGNLVDERATLRVFSNIFAELDILKNLTYRINFGPDFREYRRGLFQGMNSIARQGVFPGYESNTNAFITILLRIYLMNLSCFTISELQKPYWILEVTSPNGVSCRSWDVPTTS